MVHGLKVHNNKVIPQTENNATDKVESAMVNYHSIYKKGTNESSGFA